MDSSLNQGHELVSEFVTGPAVVINTHADHRSLKREFKRFSRHLQRMEQLIMATREELNAKIDELGHDQTRLLTQFAETLEALRVAVEAGDTAEAIAKIDALDAAVEAASPEPTEPPAEPTP